MLFRVVVFALAVAASGQQLPDPAPDVEAGQQVFESQCAVCHGVKGGGGRGPNLNRVKLTKAPDDEALRKLIRSGSSEMPGAWQLSEREVVSVAAFVRTLGSIPPEAIPGNAEQGAQIYRAKGCSSCHIVSGEGVGFGPELTNIGARRNPAHLRESLIAPASFVPEEYASADAVTLSGQRIAGVRANEDSFTIQIKDKSGRFHSFRKADLQELRVSRRESRMPSYAGSLKPDEVDDLVAYLAGLRGAQ